MNQIKIAVVGEITEDELVRVAEAVETTGFDWTGDTSSCEDALRTAIAAGAEFILSAEADEDDDFIERWSLSDKLREIGVAHIIRVVEQGRTTGGCWRLGCRRIQFVDLDPEGRAMVAAEDIARIMQQGEEALLGHLEWTDELLGADLPLVPALLAPAPGLAA